MSKFYFQFVPGIVLCVSVFLFFLFLFFLLCRWRNLFWDGLPVDRGSASKSLLMKASFPLLCFPCLLVVQYPSSAPLPPGSSDSSSFPFPKCQLALMPAVSWASPLCQKPIWPLSVFLQDTVRDSFQYKELVCENGHSWTNMLPLFG